MTGLTMTAGWATASRASASVRRLRLALVLDALLLALPAHAVSFDLFHRRRIPDSRRSLESRDGLEKRIDVSGSFGNGSTMLGNEQDAEYTCNITLGGDTFSVLIDTGR